MGDEIDHVPAKSLDHVGLTGPDTIPCVAVRWQIAQKLHACTEVFDDGENDRFRDLMDLQLLGELVADDEWSGVKAACIEVFDGRRKHSWPPDVTVYESWNAGYRALAGETSFSVADVDSSAGRAAQKAPFGVELFPNVVDGGSGLTFAEFFENERDTGRKRIVVIQIGGQK